MIVPRVFLSHSHRGAGTSLESVLQAIRRTLTSLKWVCVDPMQTNETGTIDRKVVKALYSADAIIAEATTAVPNVMFEIGVGMALGIPIIPLINETELASPTPEMRDYFRLIGLTPAKPLPSDLGALEYIPYSNDVTSPFGMRNFDNNLKSVLQGLEESMLSSGARLLRQKSRELQRKVVALVDASNFHGDHPLLRFVAGWCGRIAGELKSPSESVFEFNSEYYAACLNAFQGWDRGSTYAVADLSDETEQFWFGQPDPLRTSVTERIFLLHWKHMFDRASLHAVLDGLLSHVGFYRMYIGSVPTMGDRRRQALWLNRVGEHLLVMEPNLVAGYSSQSGRKHLRIAMDDALHAHSLQYYESLRATAIEFQRGMTADAVRRAWIQKHRIGLWNPAWPDDLSADRPSDYCQRYDMHIRCWVPDYERFTSACVETIKREIGARLVEATGRVRILEIGYGTGAVTLPLLDYIRLLNQPFSSPAERPVQAFWGLDSSAEMYRIISGRIDGRAGDVDLQFVQGTAWRGMPAMFSDAGAFDIVFGSLVLHDLVGDDAAGLRQVLTRAAALVVPGGRLVFADPFPSSNDPERERQMQYWRLWATRVGLSAEQFDDFAEHNRSMLLAVTDEDIRREASSAGFEVVSSILYPGDRRSPFGVVTLKRSGDVADAGSVAPPRKNPSQ